MQITGKVSTKLPVTTYGKEGKKKGGFVISFTEYNREKILAFTAFEKSLPAIEALNIGDKVEVEFNVDSREYQGKYYTEALVFKVEVLEAAPTKGKKVEAKVEDDDNDGLPF